MTIRDYLSKRTRILVAIELLLIGAVASMLLLDWFESSLLFSSIVVGLLVITVCIQIIGFRCVRCNKRLGPLTWNLTGYKVLGRAVNYCPFCGVSFDDEL